jgi:hypothetical protein
MEHWQLIMVQLTPISRKFRDRTSPTLPTVLGFELKVYTLSHSTSPFSCFFFFSFFENYLPRLALNCNPPDLCLLSSWDYKCEPSAPGLKYTSQEHAVS